LARYDTLEVAFSGHGVSPTQGCSFDPYDLASPSISPRRFSAGATRQQRVGQTAPAHQPASTSVGQYAEITPADPDDEGEKDGAR